MKDIHDEKRFGYHTWLKNIIHWEASQYIEKDCRRLIYDSKCLLEMMEKNESDHLSDYSFILSPLYKAIEGILIKIAKDIGIEIKHDRVGGYFTEDNIEKCFEKFEKIISDEKKKSIIKNQLTQLKPFYQRYRNDPAHYGSWFRNLHEVTAFQMSAIYNIGGLISELIKEGIIKVPPTE